MSTCLAFAAAGMKAATEALELAKKNLMNERLQVAHESNYVSRLWILQIWGSDSLQNIPDPTKVPSQPDGAICQPDAVVQQAGPAAQAAKDEEAPAQAAEPGLEDVKDGDKNPQQQVVAPAPTVTKADDAKSVDGGDATSVASSYRKVSKRLRAALEKAGSSGQHVTDLAHLMCEAEMRELLDSFMDCETLDELNNRISLLKSAATAVRELKDGAVKAAASWKSHITNRQRAQNRKRQQDHKAAEQTEVQAKKKQAKEAAEKIKQQERVIPGIFAIDWATAKTQRGDVLGTKVPLREGPTPGSIKDLDEPQCISNHSAISDFLKNAKARC